MDTKLKFIFGIALSALFLSDIGMISTVKAGELCCHSTEWQAENKLKRVRIDSLLLTEEKLKNWIETRIEVAKLQNKMKANASDYENVVHAFFEEREVLLESLGWSVEEFDEAKERIQNAISAMEIADDLEVGKADHAKEVAEIKANEFYSDQQKEELIKALEKLRNQKRKLYIEPTKRDWSAVRPYRATLEQMNAWVAGNTPNPPDVE